MTPEATYHRNRAGKAMKDAEYQRKRARRLEGENRRLRKLVIALWQYANRPVTNGRTLRECMEILDDISDEMDRLGVEVPE